MKSVKYYSLGHFCRYYKLVKIVIYTLFSLGFFILSGSVFADTLHLAVASNFIAPMKQLAKQFEQETGTHLTLSFGSSGKFFAQIQHGAPFDIFLSADTEKPQALIKKQLAQADSLVIYAKGQLVLWSVNPIEARSLKSALLAATRIAIANPKLAPYGKAAEESLQHLGISSDVQNKLVQGENISQTYQFVYSQNADLGFVALSQVLAGDGYVKNIPNEFYSEITQAAVILSSTHKTVLSHLFMTFLMRPDNQAKMLQFGYSKGQNPSK